jgi:NitT/TauT family transport system permease protein
MNTPMAPTGQRRLGVGGVLCAAALLLLAIALAFPFAGVPDDPQDPPVLPLHWWNGALPVAAWLALAAAASVMLRPGSRPLRSALAAAAALAGAWLLAALPPCTGDAPAATGFWLATAATLLLALVSVQRGAAIEGGRLQAGVAAALFGAWVLTLWQLGVSAFEVPRVLLPSPLQIAASFDGQGATLAGDFVQTVVKAVWVGWLIGSGGGFLVGVAIDRVPFLQRGLLPVASLTSTIPLVGVAPIAVMWFGFDWPSKAAVVALMTFFPMLVSTLAGLKSAGRLERELMYSYAAGYGRTLLWLRLPAALPFIFGALKVNATLALIGAIVAEFFGSPTRGLGFRISTEAARMNMPLVWAAIVVAAVTGSLAFALLVQLERRVAFWHPSVRAR